MPAEPILSAYLTSWLITVRDPIWAAGLGSVQKLKSGGAIPDARKTDKFAKYHLVMHSKRIKSDFERKKSGMKIFYKTRRCFFELPDLLLEPGNDTVNRYAGNIQRTLD